MALTKVSSSMVNEQPAFSAYASGSQTVSNATWTKVQCNTEEFDTSAAYDSSTNYRFTPQVAGYYQVNAEVLAQTTSTLIRIIPAIYKNGSAFKYSNDNIMPTGGTCIRADISSLVYLNGTTDYVEFYTNFNGSGTLSIGTTSGLDSYFQAFLVRTA